MRFSSSQLERLFVTHQRAFFVAALSITRSRAAAEDAVHDALLAVASVATEPDDLKAYVFRVIRNKALLFLKQGRMASANQTDLEFIARDSLDKLDSEQTVFITQALKQLETLELHHQQVLIMKIFADLSFREIAEIMDSPLNTVTSWYRRGLKQLQEKLDEHV
ncbi:MAG: hypothetical protein COA96_16035 [SAR86 cluster bacterium]|uniref:RNA polymerase subunit sigma-24 n=1 Tax=SAR86 cluster bacterium TaxID=2030880 RepID=A0A2A5AL64_9GAMM|nr:MAG: hypothetical protein COA96_16035 [SAR86 cluster bacterium]